MTARPHVLVVGAGIVGASIAYHLQRDGAAVTVIDAGEAGGIATRHSWAWINASWGNPEAYFRLRHRSMKLWRELGATVPGLAVNWCGGLLWDVPAAELAAYVTQHRAWGYDIRAVTREEAQRIEPHLATPPEAAVHVPEEGSVEPVAAAQVLLAAARALGAEILAGRNVAAIETQVGRAVAVVTGQGRVDADEVVIAAGTGTPDLLAPLGVQLPLSAPPGLLVVTDPQPKLLNGLAMAPQMHIRQQPDGRLIAGADFGGGDLPKDATPAVAEAAARELVAAMGDFFTPHRRFGLDHFTLGYRPTPADGFPAVGRAPGIDGLSIAVTHSGITLAPAIGASVAGAILGKLDEPLLTPYRLERFAA